MATSDTIAKRLAKRKDTEDEVRVRMASPWTNRLHDLILYQQMHAIGIRITMIEAHIREELAKLVPEGK